jgi:hypothetical protein
MLPNKKINIHSLGDKRIKKLELEAYDSFALHTY